MQKIVQTVPADALQFVVDAFVGHVYTFATHPYSCRVLQRIFENCPDRMTRPLLEELKSYAQNLMQDQYGNYVVQFILEKGFPQDKSDIITQIYGQVLHLSKHKFASNGAVGDFFGLLSTAYPFADNNICTAGSHREVYHERKRAGDPGHRWRGTRSAGRRYHWHLVHAQTRGEPPSSGLYAHSVSTGASRVAEFRMLVIGDQYANYPLQRLIKHTSGTLHIAIVDQVSAQLAQFRMANPPFTAKHLIAVEKLLLDISPDSFPTLMPRRYEDHYLPRAR